jgi:hypothetical protein
MRHVAPSFNSHCSPIQRSQRDADSGQRVQVAISELRLPPRSRIRMTGSVNLDAGGAVGWVHPFPGSGEFSGEGGA